MGFRELAKDHVEFRAQTIRNVEKMGEVVNTLAQEHAKTRGAVRAFVTMSFWRRLRWLLTGKA